MIRSGPAHRWLVLLACLLMAACGNDRHAAAGGAAMAAAQPAQDQALAYEHEVSVVLEADVLQPRLAQVQAACQEARFGPCEVLAVSHHGGDWPSARLVARIAPQGVEPLIAQAGEGGELGSRVTRAEDLAHAVADNARTRDRLQREQARLQEFGQRPDLAVADMIALSRQASEVEVALEAAAQEQAQQQRRIQTHLVSIDFTAAGRDGGAGEIRQALRDFAGILAAGTAWTIRAVAFLIPVAAVVAVLVLGWRWFRRRRRG